jgi:RNA polymerase sigma-70 factor (ECF subfamily)
VNPGPDTRTDVELLRASGSDPEAFGVLYDRHIRAVLAFLARRTGSPEDAADLAAETFAAAFLRRWHFVDRGAPVGAWLIGIARRELLMSLRKERIATRARRRLGIPRLELDDEELRRIEELADLPRLRSQLNGALAELAPGIAAAVSLRVKEDLGYPEVARRLDCSEGAARLRVARGLAKLADRLEEDR